MGFFKIVPITQEKGWSATWSAGRWGEWQRGEIKGRRRGWQEVCPDATGLHSEDLVAELQQQILLNKPRFFNPTPNCRKLQIHLWERLLKCGSISLLWNTQGIGSGRNPSMESDQTRMHFIYQHFSPPDFCAEHIIRKTGLYLDEGWVLETTLTSWGMKMIPHYRQKRTDLSLKWVHWACIHAKYWCIAY